MGLKSYAKQFLYKINSRRYQKALETRRVSYQDWITGVEKEFGVGAIDGGEDFLLFCNPEGREAVCARAWIADWLRRYPEALVLYGDEDVLDGEERRAPYFKPDWSPNLFEDQFYPGGLVAVRRSWLERQDREVLERAEALEGRGRELAEQSGLLGQRADRDDFGEYRRETQRLVRGLVELAGGYEKGLCRKRILHIPRMLFHSGSEESRERWMQYAEGIELQDSTKNNMSYEKSAVPGGGRLSIVIPSKDNPDLLEKCIRSIPAAAEGMRYEIIVVDNGSGQDEKARIERALEHIRREGLEGLEELKYHYVPMEFNFSRMCNMGAENTKGEQLLFLNDDVELVQPGSLRAMSELAARSYVGAVGLKLLYPDGDTLRQIQHAGITNLPMGPVHKLQFCRDGENYYFGWNSSRRNVLAVTAACLMVERDKFREAGGFAEELAVAFNDVELCFELYELGYENVCDCGHYALHDESYSRGDDESPEKLERLLLERGKLYERHPGLEGRDPYYSVYLNGDGLDTRIRPLYETAGNRVQRLGYTEEIAAGSAEEKNLKKWQNACLMVRVESALRAGDEDGKLRLTGWSVVLGDNNACYERFLILKQDLSNPKYFVFLLQGQYRPDLAENMPDQINVGLCGYMVELGRDVLPAGRYLVGAVARNRVNGMRLANWSNRTVELI